MSFQNKHQVLRHPISNQIVREMIAKALRFEHRNDVSKIKHTCLRTGINLNTISKWYSLRNVPSSSHLLILASLYPEVLRGVLEIIGRNDVWGYCVMNNIPNKMFPTITAQSNCDAFYRDKYVHIDVIVKFDMALKLNQRQLWFIGELQNGKHIGANEIAKTWQKSYRTSKRDIQGLTKIGLVDRIGARKNGYYSLNQGVV